HPPEFVQACEGAIERLLAFRAAGPMERGAQLPAIRQALASIGERLAELDWEDERYAREQGTVQDAASALGAIELDRGGPQVPRYVDRIIDDLRRIATG
ncbi:MAG TPA: hypothetical protein VEY93_16260, partial [Longimicrobium sp.]|nr:hypothetical protein [Longimicrobium sp.]